MGADCYTTFLAVADQPELRDANGALVASGEDRHVVDQATRAWIIEHGTRCALRVLSSLPNL